MPAFTRSRRVYVLVIWSLLAAVLTGAFLLSGLAAADPAPALGVSGTELSAPVSEARSAASDAQVKQFVKDYYASKGSRVGLLPAYRWNGDADLYDKLDMGDGGSLGGRVISGVFFSVSQFLWMIILQVMRLVMDNTIIDAAADAINNGSAGLAKNLRMSGLVALAIGAMAVAAAFAVLRSNLVSAGRILIIGMLMLATMQVVASAGAQARPGAQPVGSPAWLAQFSTSQVNSVTDKMSSGFGLSQKLSDNIRGGGKTEYNCQTYVGFLQDAYNEAATVDQKAAPLLPMSKLWEKGYLTYFTQAQYGFGTGSPTRSVCHQLDAQARISFSEVSDVMRVAYSPAPVPKADVMSKEPYKSTNVLPVAMFAPVGEREKFEANVMAWQACSVNSSDPGSSPGNINMVINPGWEFDDLDDDKCKEWINDGVLGFTGSSTFFTWGSDDNLSNAVHNARTDKETVADMEAIENTSDMLNAFWGHNANDRIINGLMATLVASVYAYVLIPLALGTLIAEFGLVLMMVLLPLTLLLLAAGAASSRKRDKSGGGGSNKSHEIGMRLLKLTGGFVAAKALLTFLLFALVQFIAVVEELSTELPFSPILHILTPLIALFLLRFILKSAGLGNLTSLGGALGMTAASGMQMVAGKDSMVGGLGGAKGKFGNNPLTRGANRMDAATKQRLRDNRFTKPSGRLSQRKQPLPEGAPGDKEKAALGENAASAPGKSAEAEAASKKRKALAAVTTPFTLASSAMHRSRSWRKRMTKEGYANTAAYDPNDPKMPKPTRRAAGDYQSPWMHAMQHSRERGGGGKGGVGALTAAESAAMAPGMLAAAGAVALTEEGRRQRMLAYDQKVSAAATAALTAGSIEIGKDEDGNPIMSQVGTMSAARRITSGVNLMDTEQSAFKRLSTEQQLAVTNPVERAALLSTVAENFSDGDSGIPFTTDQFIMSDSGEIFLSHVPRNPETGELVIPRSRDPQMLVDVMNDYTNFLPPVIRDRRQGETEQHYADRLIAYGIELGFIDQSTGQHVDFWKTRGLSDDQVSHLIEDAYAGNSNMLTTLTLDVSQPVVARAEQAVAAKYEILRNLGGVDRSYQLLSRTDGIINERRQEVQVELDVGKTTRTHVESTAAHVVKLDSELRVLTNAAQHIQSFDAAITQAQAHLASAATKEAQQQIQVQVQRTQEQRAEYLTTLPQNVPSDPQQLQVVIESKERDIVQQVAQLEGFLDEVETAASQSASRSVELKAASTQQEIALSMESSGLHSPKEIESTLVASESKVGEQLDAAHREVQRRLTEASDIYNNPELPWKDRIRARVSASDSILADSKRVAAEVVSARQQSAEQRAAAQRQLADAATATLRSQDEVLRHGMSLPSA